MDTTANCNFNADVRTLVSKDGTSIAYRTTGQGPAVVLIQGTMNTGYNFRDLTCALADTFTVIVPDRRGRGLSGSGVADYCLARELEDLDTVLSDTGARLVFGLSSGALIALQAALQLPGIDKVAIYEPPLFPKDAVPEQSIMRTNAALDRSDIPGALVAGMKGGQFGPPFMLALPDWLLKLLIRVQPAPKETAHPESASMHDLAWTLRNDFALVKELAGSHTHYQRLTIPALLIGGSATGQDYLRNALTALASQIPNVTSVEIAGVDHSGPLNRDQMGKPGPELVATELRTFFLS